MSEFNMKKIAVLISGRGSNLKSLIDAVNQKSLSADITLVMSNKPQAQGLSHAQKAGIATLAIEADGYQSHQAYEEALLLQCRVAKVDYIVLAGYMKLLGETMLSAYAGKIINIHPSLLPKYKGLKAQKQALEAGEKVSGCTVHFVTSQMDAGPIIAQQEVEVREGDTEESLAGRILLEEHRLFPKALQDVLDGKFKNIENKLQKINS